MEDSLLFTAFLDDLRRRGLAIGLRESELFYRLIARFEGDRTSDLRDAIAALLARNQAEVVLIRRVFDDLLTSESTPEPPAPVRARRIWPWVAAALAAVVLAIVISPISRCVEAPDGSDSDSDPGSGPGTAPTPDDLPPRPPEPEPATVDAARLSYDLLYAPWPYLLWSGCASAALLALVALRRAQAYGAAVRGHLQARLAAIPGPQHVRIVAPPYQGLATDTLNDFATWIGRIVAERLPARQLDAEGTVLASARRGHPVLVFADRPPGRVLVVLEDVGPEMRPWRRKVTAFVTGIAQRGVHIQRWTFDTHAVTISARAHGAPVPLSALTGTVDGRMLVVVSTGMGVLGEGRVLSGWVRELAAFPARVWLNPIVDESLWRGGLARVPMPVLPLTGSSLAQVARVLGADVPDAAVQAPTSGTRALVGDPADELRQLAALMPAVDVDLLMWLRESFLPHVPEETVLAIYEKYGAWGGRRLHWQPGERAAAIKRLRRNHPGREGPVRQRLLELYDDSEPPAGSAAHLRWRLARIEQAAFLASPADAAPVQRELVALAASPIGEETDELLGLLHATATRAGFDRGERRSARAWRRPVRTIRSQARWDHARAAGLAVHPPRGTDVMRALVLGGLAVGAAVMLRHPVTSAPNIKAAYELGTVESTPPNEAPSLIVRSSKSGSPDMGDVLQDGKVVEHDVQLLRGPLPPVERGHWYQLRARLPSGAWALSQQMGLSQLALRAAPTGTGTLLVHLFESNKDRSLDPRPIMVDGTKQISGNAIELKAGRHEVTAQVEGFDPAAATIAVDSGRSAVADLELHRRILPDVAAWAKAHNRVREKHCAGPLSWSPQLAQVAQRWADSLRDRGCAHDLSDGQFGENIAFGTPGWLGPESAVKIWDDDGADYRFPDGGFSTKTSTFTQLVWRGTKRVGCARSHCNNEDLVVCEYDPPGNQEGEYEENVLPLGCQTKKVKVQIAIDYNETTAGFESMVESGLESAASSAMDLVVVADGGAFIIEGKATASSTDSKCTVTIRLRQPADNRVLKSDWANGDAVDDHSPYSCIDAVINHLMTTKVLPALREFAKKPP